MVKDRGGQLLNWEEAKRLEESQRLIRGVSRPSRLRRGGLVIELLEYLHRQCQVRLSKQFQRAAPLVDIPRRTASGI